MTLPRIKRVTARGKVFLYHRAPGGKLVRLPDLPEDDPELIAAWLAEDRKYRSAEPQRAGPRSVAALVDAYLKSREFANLAANTKANRRSTLRRIEATKDGAGGRVNVSALDAEIIAADLEAFAPAVAHGRLKAWRAILAYAVKPLGWIKSNPALAVARPRLDERPHEAWTPAEVARFRETWPLGSPQRTAFELLYWTAARRSDVVKMGRQNVADGWLRWRQTKTGGVVEVPISGGLADALRHVPPGRMTFLETEEGAARTAKGFGEWFAAACGKAKVEKRAHGLRHTFGADAAEAGISSNAMRPVLGHESSQQSEKYAAQANRRKMASDTMRAVERKREMESGRGADGKRLEK